MRGNRLRDGIELFVASKLMPPTAVAQARLVKAVSSGDLKELDKAIEHARRVLADPAVDLAAERQLMFAFCLALNLRHSRMAQQADLDEAITVSRQVLVTLPEGDADRVLWQFGLSGFLLDRSNRLSDRADLDEALTALRDALMAAPAGQPLRAALLSNVGYALTKRFEWTGDRADLDEAIPAIREALAGTEQDAAGRPQMQATLGGALMRRSQLTGDQAERGEALAALRTALAAMPADDPARARLESDLGIMLAGEFQPTELDEAVSVARQAVAGTPAGHPDRGLLLARLGGVMVRRFERTGSRADLDEVIPILREALQLSQPGDPGREQLQEMLGAALVRRSELSGDRADLDAAVGAYQDAPPGRAAGHPARAGLQSGMSIALLRRFEQTGQITDLNAAVQAARQAVGATPAGTPIRAGTEANLGTVLLARFIQAGAGADLDEAIAVTRAALDRMAEGHPSQATAFAALGTALVMRFQRTGQRPDLDAAIIAGTAAVERTPVGDAERGIRLNALSAALLSRFALGEDRADIWDALSYARQAVTAVPVGHAQRPRWLIGVCNALMTQFEATSDRADLDEAVSAARHAVQATPSGHPDQARWLAFLSMALGARYEETESEADLAEATSAARQAAQLEVASPRVRANAAQLWGQAAGTAEQWDEAVTAYQAAASLIGLMVPRSLAQGDQEDLLTELDGLASQALACCVQAGRSELGVELFEQSRGVILGQLLDARTDLTELAAAHPGLAHRLTERLEQIEGEASGSADEVGRRRALVAEIDLVIAEIRAEPGFTHFLRPLAARDLATAAADGPVVIVNVSEFGSHALILTSTGVLDPVALEGLSPNRVAEGAARFLTLIKSGDESELTALLEWLWDSVAGPVLDRLGFTGPPDPGQPWQRLWWCVSGLLSCLPLHAAGYHQTSGDPSPRTVLDRVASSYTPTVRALIHARRAPATPAAGGASWLVVAMPKTPGYADLPGAHTEAELLLKRFRDAALVSFTGPEATHDAVARALPSAAWAHFACHGRADLASPSNSALLLQDNQDHPLTVVDIARLRLEHAEFAFLSACSTANPGTGVPDEAIHLASAFQLAGYRQVIGTLWPIDDHRAVGVANDLYRTLGGPGTASGAAVALHEAIRRMREKRRSAPSAWASHIHVGA
jgi:tetratricopeptide (TPR) repeat protein